jgi:hypothetical protein
VQKETGDRRYPQEWVEPTSACLVIFSNHRPPAAQQRFGNRAFSQEI